MKSGIVKSAVYDDWSFKVGDPPKTLYQHTITLEEDNGTITIGKYHSVSQEQTTFVTGQHVKVETEEKTSKNGNVYYKFKLYKDPNAGGGFGGGKRKDYNDPVINAQIERMTSLAAALELNHYFPVEVGKVARMLAKFVSDSAQANGGTKQASITAQSAMKSAIQAYANPTNKEDMSAPTVDMIIEKALQFQKFIVNG
jgi:hypothetical protein